MPRSTLEAYGAAFLTIVTVVFPMTWWLCIILTFATALLAIDVCARVEMSRFPFASKLRWIFSLFVFCIVLSSGFTRAFFIAKNSAQENIDHFAVPEIEHADVVALSSERFAPSVTIKNAGGAAMINYDLLFSTKSFLQRQTREEEKKIFSQAKESFIKMISQIDETNKIQKLLQPSSNFTLSNPHSSFTATDVNNLREQKLFAYIILYIVYKDRLPGAKIFARLCAIIPPNNQITYLQCATPNIEHDEQMIKDP